MTYLKDLSLRLCMTSVFRSVVEKPVFNHFFDFSKDELDMSFKIKSYAAFLEQIYINGGSLTELVKKLVFEDENIYVKLLGKGKTPSKNIIDAVNHELSIFSEFASLTKDDFKKELGVDYVSEFSSEKIDLTELYAKRIENIRSFGYGIFSSYTMFRLSDEKEIEPIISADKISIDSFVGYEEERGKVLHNTKAFIEGRPAANVLLCGDAGTGKSSTVKAIANLYFDKGIRLIEIRKDQLSYLPYVMGKISENPLKFIIFIDDLAFNKSDDNFSMLKAALEGSASAKADNAVIYATSNRRHIIKETFDDRAGNEVHRNDTMQESLSLSERFGLVVLFSKPAKALYLDIVHELARKAKINMDKDELDIKAEAFALKRGNRSARCAEQFIKSLM